MNFWKSFGASMLAIGICTAIAVTVILTTTFSIMKSFEAEVPSTQDHTVLYISLDENITNAPGASAMGSFNITDASFDISVTLLDVLAAIERAATDDRIKGICIKPSGAGVINLADIEELRHALNRFKLSGKFIVAYDDTYTQSDYYLATVADSIIMQPEGSLDWHGMGMTVMYFKGLMDKFGITAEIFRPTDCKCKSAVEPFIRTDMSPENRAQSETIINSWWDSIIADVAAARNIDGTLLKRYAHDLSVNSAEEALSAGMIDVVAYEDYLYEVFDEYGVNRNAQGLHNTTTLGDYIMEYSFLRPQISVDDDSALSFSNSPLIAVIYAEGEIVDGDEYVDGYVYGSRLAAELRHARLNDNCKAVVMRVNSPGGSALASDVAWREMVLLQQTKPVVVSMGDMAASGGYYISAPADYIFADRLTLTGSIGVFGSLFNFEKLITNMAGVTIDSALTSPSAGGISLFTQLTEQQRATILKGVDKVYKTFTSHVSEGRNIPIEDVLKIAEGRIWSGSNALELGLVDAIGGFNEAILKAAELADVINDFELYEYTAPSTPFDQWIKSMGIVHASMWGLDFNVYGAEICDILSRVPFTMTNNGIQAMLPGNVTKVF